jgi:hypothetical protein
MKRFLVVGCVALGSAAVLAVAPPSALAGPKAYSSPARALYVTSVTPARNRHLLPDMSDPGVNNSITVTFSAALDARGLIDSSDPYATLGPKCDFHDHRLAKVPASAGVFRNFLTIDPFNQFRPVLPPGRYTLTLKSSIRSAGGALLNGGGRGFTTTFFVGSATNYPPVLLRISPTAGGAGVALRRPIVAVFDAPIDAASAQAAIRLEDRGTFPPTPIPIRVRTARRGFAVVVEPAARSGYPRGADLALVVAGQVGSTEPSSPVLTETGGKAFTRDLGPGWTVDPDVPTLFHSVNGDFDEVTGEFTLTFRTRGVSGR